jgi:mycothiol synthase
MQAAFRPRIIPGISHLARRYVNWRERNVRRSLLKMRLVGLQERASCGETPAGVRILPLTRCGSEWLLRRVFNETSAETPGFCPCRPVDVLAFSASPIHDRHGVMLAQVDGRYVGTCVGRVYPDGTGTIASLTVHPEYRGRGIGHALLQATLGYLRGRGAHSAVLYLDDRNEAALRLYLRAGFEPARPDDLCE